MQTIETKYGEFIAQHTANELRRKEILPVVFHESGVIKSLPLESQQTVVTPAGEIPAELISFHANGCINRIFPLNGKLSGYWAQEDEANLARPVTLVTPSGTITTRIIGISFYENETLRSITLWPGETISISTPAGMLDTRIGVSFTPDGEVSSLEPAKPTPVKTAAGEITAYDPDAIGVNGDWNSLVFDKSGAVVRVTTTLTRVKAVHPNGTTTVFTPGTRESLCSESEEEVVPMVVEMDQSAIRVRTSADRPVATLPMDTHVFFSEPYLPQLANFMEMMRCSV
ncbi:hypothetical protein [Pseudodesulfovibrio piezophilus]|uniref:Uncharacterized protein n=1 Tax=Pseudodesulfovibrio piezophilus (strain DSM 21447 / JCM 15486 / C1TLV30) TaxID=1322246 RepID=M1WU19_PSEP2|nr:hypothetical protein [Pseudodesulfovibrio piezophilus]CCH50127.1 conserved protein of unknown function [Pseudodesulfovibrio piezophilus C1TLV30]